jgi:hypothetical protein
MKSGTRAFAETRLMSQDEFQGLLQEQIRQAVRLQHLRRQMAEPVACTRRNRRHRPRPTLCLRTTAQP